MNVFYLFYKESFNFIGKSFKPGCSYRIIIRIAVAVTIAITIPVTIAITVPISLPEALYKIT